MNTLEKIVAHKRKETEERKSLYPVKLLERTIYFNSPPVSLRKYLLRDDRQGIIAEIKRKSPSKGAINKYVSIERTSIGYMQAGASALSILTDQEYFGGKNEDLTTARKFNYCPILRKDFVVDEYQVIEAKSIGADVVLLLANVLNKDEIASFSELAKSLGLEVLLEVRQRDELHVLNQFIDIVGVNNRDLTDFSVELSQSFKLAEHIPAQFIKISESGIDSPEQVIELRKHGYKGFLMGEKFMKEGRPERACAEFITQLKSKRAEQIK